MLPVVALLLVVAVSADKDPNREEKHVSFETAVSIECTGQDNDRFMWLPDKDRPVCTPYSYWCSLKETKIPAGGTVSTLTLKRVITSGNYTCITTSSEGVQRDVSITTLIVGPKVEPTRYIFFGESRPTQTIHCIVETPYLQVRLVRDNNEICEQTWCVPRNDKPKGASSKSFLVKDLTSNHTYSCEAYNNASQIFAVSVLQILVGPAPEFIHVSHNSEVRKGDSIMFAIEFESLAPVLQRIYRINGVETDIIKEYDIKQVDSTYSYNVTFGPVNETCQLSLEVVNTFGSKRNLIANVVVKGIPVRNETSTSTESPSRGSSTIKPSTIKPSTIQLSTEPVTIVIPQQPSDLPQGRHIFIKANVVKNYFFNCPVKQQK